MDKKIMLAVDDSIHSKYAVKYAVAISSTVKDLHYVLFHVQPVVSHYLLDEAKKSLKAKAELDKVIKKNEASAREILEQYKNDMARMGIEEDRIETVTQLRTLGLAKDIIDFGHMGRYDAIVVGSRRMSRLQRVFMGSVSANLLEHSEFIPVWVVDGEVASDKIMVAVDGSESSLRAVDHVSFMLMGNTHVGITLLHVMSKAKELCEENLDQEPSAELEDLVSSCDKKQIDQFYKVALKKFKDAGISENQIEILTLENRNRPGRVIIETAEKGNFGTVVIGRRGINKSFFTGSVSHHVINKISGCVLWVVS
ncbi:MAG: universal stress protein [Desulfobacterales bacterium]|jgi:nucleotide-binding universal stress UspA family protein